MNKKIIHIGKQKWTVEDIRNYKSDTIPVDRFGTLSIDKEFVLSVDKISQPMTYDLMNFIRKELTWDFLKDKTNKHYCEIKNPYVPQAEDILYNNASDSYSVMIVERNGKYGLIDEFCNTIIPIENDEIHPTLSYLYPYWIVKHNNISYIYHVLKYQIVSKFYDRIEIVSQRHPRRSKTDEYLKAYKDGKCGLIHEQGVEIVPPIYDDCFGSCWFLNYDKKHKYIIVTKDSKQGILNELGEVIAEIKYDNIRFSYPVREGINDLHAIGKIGSEEFILIESGINNNINKRGKGGSNYTRQTYERYGGSYAQDEMGYSDDDIDTIFEGDPDNYWNID